MTSLALKLPLRWDAMSRAIVTNAGSLVGTMVVNSGLGYLYWGFAARQFSTAEVGLAAAAISAMTLLGGAGALGLGTLLVGELPRRPGAERSLVTAALLLAGAAGAGLGVLFALLSPLIAVDLRPLAESPLAVALFALGVGLTAGTVVLDQVLVGLLRGELQLGRNALFAAAKLGALLVVGFWVADRHGLTIFATWLAGILASLAVLAGIELRHRQALGVYRPEWGTLGRLGLRVLGHQALNLALQTPQLALPVVVTAVLSATMTAYFYVASMVAGLVYAIPVSLTAAIYAVGARAPSELAHRLRFSLKLSVLLSVLANGALLVIAEFVLSLFGHEYAERGAASLRILAIGVLPMIVKDHYVAICRVHGLVGRAAVLVATGGCIELILAAVGARWGGLTGLSLGWVAALALEAAMMAPTVYRAAAAAASASGGAGPMGDQERPERQPEWRMV